MNINMLEKFTVKIKKYQFLYGFLVVGVIFFLIGVLFRYKNINAREYKGFGLADGILVINNLNLDDIDFILNCEDVIINDKKQAKIIFEVGEDENYFVKLESKEIKKEKEITIRFVLKEENLYQFIVRNMKGEWKCKF